MPFAEVNDIRMYYEEEGQGQPLILLHGATGSIDAMSGWPRMRPALSARYRCLLVEYRGHSRTNNPAGSMSYALIADDMARFIESLNLAPAHLAGVSDGATVGLALGMTRPVLLRSLVCIGVNIYMDDQLREAMSFFDAGAIERAHPEYARTFAARHDPHHHAGYWKELVKKVRENVEAELNWTKADLQRIPVPTLLIAGENDAFVSVDQMLDMRRWLPDAEMLILNHAGLDGLSSHLPQFSRAEVLEPVILDFLDRHSLGVPNAGGP